MDLTVPVTVQSVGRGRVEATISATGGLRALRMAQLTTEVQGLYHLVPDEGGRSPHPGTSVKAGQLVARLENEELVVNARRGSRQLASDVAERTLSEKQVLYKRGLVTQKEVDDAQRSVEEARSSLQDAIIQIRKTEIRSPIAGCITGLSETTEGTLMDSRTVIATVMDYTRVIMELKVPNAYIARIFPGQMVRVRNYAFPDETFTGKVTGVDPALDPATRTFSVEATVENPNLRLRPGMFAEAEVVTEAREDVVVIPRGFITKRRNQDVVFIEEEGRAQMVEVKTGLGDREDVEITEGLEAGDRLITSNFETLRARTRVRVTGEGVLGK